MEEQKQQHSQSLDNSVVNTSTGSDPQYQSTFNEKIKDQKSQKIKENLLGFIRDVQGNKIDKEKVPELVSQKIQELETQFQNIWQENEEIQEGNGEVIEAVITKALYQILFDNIDKELDNQMHLAFKVFSFLKVEYLDLNPQFFEHKNFEKAQQQIRNLNIVKSPKEKLACIINCCKLISNMLATQNSELIGADEFLPSLVYTVLKVAPENPISNLEFIRIYRGLNRIVSSDDYYITVFQSSLEFISQIEGDKLNCDQQHFQKEYQNKMNKYRKEFEEKQQNLKQQKKQNKQLSEVSKEECMQNLYELRTKVYDLQDNYNQLERKNKLNFINRPQNQISIAELPEFFYEYQVLAKHYADMQRKIENLTQATENLLKNKPKKQTFLGNIFS